MGSKTPLKNALQTPSKPPQKRARFWGGLRGSGGGLNDPDWRTVRTHPGLGPDRCRGLANPLPGRGGWSGPCLTPARQRPRNWHPSIPELGGRGGPSRPPPDPSGRTLQVQNTRIEHFPDPGFAPTQAPGLGSRDLGSRVRRL